MEYFEAGMLICFGCSWPLNSTKSLRSHTAKGKSMAFEVLVLMGYICGVTGKFIGGHPNWVTVIYVLDLMMVTTDILLTLHNRRLDRERDREREVAAA